jgi:carbonic anhydrase
LTIFKAISPADFDAAIELFLEYASSLGFSLCFQGFDIELANISGIYAHPTGAMILARSDLGELVACVGVKRFDTTTCEMKRLYVKPTARKNGLGDQLIAESICAAKDLGYKRMNLDTIRETMKPAISLYRRQGFVEIPSYYPNPMEGVLYMSKELDAEAGQIA